MELRVLGPIEVRHDGSPVGLRGAKPRQLLALFAMRPDRPATAEELIEELWEGDAPPSAATALRVHVGRLRQVLEPERNPNSPSMRLPAVPHGYLLRLEPDELDVERFERLTVLARDANAGGDPGCAIAQLTEALDMWRGPAFVDIQDLSASRAEIVRLQELRAVAIEELADARLVLGEHTFVIDVLSAAITEYPLRERLTAQLMLALYRSGRQADALATFSALRGRLDDELGVEPSPELRRLEEDVLLQRPNLDLGPSRSVVAPAHARASAVRFVGRRPELARLLERIGAAETQGSRLILVTGPAGIGKTTLVQEARARFVRQRVIPFVGGCDPQPTGQYQPIIEILRQVVESLDSGARASLPADLGLLLPELSSVTADDTDAVVDTQAARFRLFDAVTSTLARAAPRRVLVLEDVHWADRPTLRLVRRLLRDDRLEGLVVIATYRDDEIGGDQAELAGALAPPGRTDVLTLTGFSENDVRALVRAVASPDAMHHLVDFAPTLRTVTAGNPFFLRELLRELGEETNKITDARELARVVETIAPDGVRAVVDRRLERLTPQGRQLARAAAAIGRDLSVELLAQVCRVTEETAFDALEECLAGRLLVEEAQDLYRYQFPHALVRNAIYAAIPLRPRMQLHERIAQLLETFPDRSEWSNADLAYHYCQARPQVRDKAITYMQRAGHDAAGQFAFAEAARWYDAALEMQAETDVSDTIRGRLLLLSGRAHANDRQVEPARAAFAAAAECARRAHDVSLLADIALAADGPWSTGVEFGAVALPLLEEALEQLDAGDAHRRVQLLNGIASDLYYTEPGREGECAHEALHVARQHDDPTSIATAQLALHRWYTHQPEAYRDRLALASAALDLVQPEGATGDLHLLIRRSQLGDQLEAGDLASFDAGLDTYEALATKLGSPRDIYWAMALRATQTMHRGDLTRAEQVARGAALRGRELGQHSEGLHVLQRFTIRYQQGRLAEELSVLRSTGDASSVFRAGAALAATAFSETRQRDRAKEVARGTLGDDGSLLARDVFWLAAVALFAGVAVAVDDPALVRMLDDFLQPCAGQVVVFGVGGAVLGTGHHWLGLLSLSAGDTERALQHLTEAAVVSERLAAPFWVAQARIDAARALDRRGRAQDRAEIERLTDGAVMTAQSRGYGRILTQAAALRSGR